MAITAYYIEEIDKSIIYTIRANASQYIVFMVEDLIKLFENEEVDFFFSIEQPKVKQIYPTQETKVSIYSFAGDKRNIIIKVNSSSYLKEKDEVILDKLFNYKIYTKEQFVNNLKLFIKYRSIELALKQF